MDTLISQKNISLRIVVITEMLSIHWRSQDSSKMTHRYNIALGDSQSSEDSDKNDTQI